MLSPLLLPFFELFRKPQPEEDKTIYVRILAYNFPLPPSLFLRFPTSVTFSTKIHQRNISIRIGTFSEKKKKGSRLESDLSGMEGISIILLTV